MDIVPSNRNCLGLLVSLELEFFSMARVLGRLDSATTTVTPTLQTDTWGSALCPEVHIHGAGWPVTYFLMIFLLVGGSFTGKGEERYPLAEHHSDPDEAVPVGP